MESSLAVRIAAFRRSKGWSQRALAARIKRNQSAVAQWETGATEPRQDNLRRLAAAFEVPLQKLMFGPLPARRA